MALEPEKRKQNAGDVPHLDDALKRARLPAVRVSLADRPVLLVQKGRVACGVDAQRLELRQLTEGARSAEQPGFSEVIFRTSTGNAYHIHRLESQRWAIRNARRNVETYLPDTELWEGVLEVGKRFSHNSRHTAHVMQVVALADGRSVSGNFDLPSVFGAALRHGRGEVLFLPSFGSASQLSEFGNPAVHSKFSQQRRPVLVLGGHSLFVGSERAGLYLRELVAKRDSPAEATREIVFRTVSGNLYGILRGGEGAAVLVNSRGSAPVILSDEELAQRKIAVGHRFALDAGKRSSDVSHIISITGLRCPVEKASIEGIRARAVEISSGNVSFSREELIQSVIKNLGRDQAKRLLGLK